MNNIISLPIEKYSMVNMSDDLAKVEINVYHEGYNPNGSFFETCCFENSKESFKNKPLCCAYDYKSDGEVEDFKGHEIEEQPCGVIPETNNYCIKKIDDISWVNINAFIFKEYCPEAYELLSDGKKISMEIEVLDGFKGNDGFYHIKQFNLLCITVLGDDYAPAMGDNATINLFKNINNDNFAMKFSEIINKAKLIADQSEGGNKVNRNEIIAKFSTIKNVEGYNAIVENKELSDEELEKQLFALSQGQIENAIREVIKNEKIIKTYWDGEAYETEKYMLEDTLPSENIAVLWSRDDYRNYGVTYSMEGDKANIDFSAIKRYVRGDWRVFHDGEVEVVNPISVFAEEIVGQATKEIENIKGSFNASETEEYKSLETNLNTVKAEFADLQSEKTLLDEEIETLRKFKLEKDKECKESEINSILSEFVQLKDIEGYDEIVKDKFEISSDDLIKKLKVFAYDNGVIIKKQKFSKNTKEPTQLIIDDNISNNNSYTGAWNILDKYK